MVTTSSSAPLPSSPSIWHNRFKDLSFPPLPWSWIFYWCPIVVMNKNWLCFQPRKFHCFLHCPWLMKRSNLPITNFSIASSSHPPSRVLDFDYWTITAKNITLGQGVQMEAWQSPNFSSLTCQINHCLSLSFSLSLILFHF